MQTWTYVVTRNVEASDTFEKLISIEIQISKTDRISEPIIPNFKFRWSTDLENCNVKKKHCPMKDPRSNWEEKISHKIWLDTGIY